MYLRLNEESRQCLMKLILTSTWDDLTPRERQLRMNLTRDIGLLKESEHV
jgi:hypothetical protein